MGALMRCSGPWAAVARCPAPAAPPIRAADPLALALRAGGDQSCPAARLGACRQRMLLAVWAGQSAGATSGRDAPSDEHAWRRARKRTAARAWATWVRPCVRRAAAEPAVQALQEDVVALFLLECAQRRCATLALEIEAQLARSAPALGGAVRPGVAAVLGAVGDARALAPRLFPSSQIDEPLLAAAALSGLCAHLEPLVARERPMGRRKRAHAAAARKAATDLAQRLAQWLDDPGGLHDGRLLHRPWAAAASFAGGTSVVDVPYGGLSATNAAWVSSAVLRFGRLGAIRSLRGS